MTPRVLLVQQLQALGLHSGDVVMVHASLRAVGPVEGRANGLLHAILDTIGPDGTLAMVLGADPDDPFDALHTPVDVEDMGWLAEVFRTFPGVRVSDHAAARWAARGPLAAALIDAPPLHDYHGPEGTLQRLVHHRAKVLRLGADPDTLTLTHLVEYHARVPHKRRVRLRYVRADIGEQWIASLDDTHGIVDAPEYFEEVLEAFLDAGHARLGPVGRCTAQLIDARAFVDFAVPWLEHHLGSTHPQA